MLKVNRLIMETCKFIVILLLYCVTTAYCYPSKPLNERSPPDLTWQAWLLFDDQNQNKQQTNADGMLRRRITPKSVFIAPTFSPDSLPPCAEGYTSDVMGRCVPIIKIDEDRHYGFLIERLKEKFGPLDYDYQMEDEMSTQGPLQLNIPLQGDIEEDEETDVAIVISPTKALGVNVDKRDSMDDEKKQEFFLKKLAATTRQPEEITTFTVPVTNFNSEGAGTVTEEMVGITEPLTTTEDMAFSTLSHYTKRSTDNLEKDVPTTTEDLPETTTFDPTTIRDKEISSTFPPKFQLTKSESHTPMVFKFPEDTVTDLKSSFVKFPEDVDVSFQTQIPSSVELGHNTRDVHNDAPFHQLADTPVSERKVVFRDKSQPEEANLDYSNGARHLSPTTTHRSFNRRNRDKSNSMFLLPPRWSQPNFQKPLVLRFSRKHAYLDEEQFKHPDYYRAVPMDDYAFLFSKHKQSSHR